MRSSNGMLLHIGCSKLDATALTGRPDVECQMSQQKARNMHHTDNRRINSSCGVHVVHVAYGSPMLCTAADAFRCWHSAGYASRPKKNEMKRTTSPAISPWLNLKFLGILEGLGSKECRRGDVDLATLGQTWPGRNEMHARPLSHSTMHVCLLQHRTRKCDRYRTILHGD
jgi:hypothetical protein